MLDCVEARRCGSRIVENENCGIVSFGGSKEHVSFQGTNLSGFEEAVCQLPGSCSLTPKVKTWQAIRPYGESDLIAIDTTQRTSHFAFVDRLPEALLN